MNRDEVFLYHILDKIHFVENQTKSLEFEDFFIGSGIAKSSFKEFRDYR